MALTADWRFLVCSCLLRDERLAAPPGCQALFFLSAADRTNAACFCVNPILTVPFSARQLTNKSTDQMTGQSVDRLVIGDVVHF